MTDKELIDYLLETRQHIISNALEYWFVTCSRFKEFAYFYRDKIRSKIRSANDEEDLEDIRFELEIPYLMLLDNRFEVEYEKYNDNNVRAPDFIVTFEQSIAFNLEVKRIRESILGVSFDKLIREIVSKIQRQPSKLGFSIDITTLDATPDILSRLESSKEKVIQYIENTIRKEESKISFDSANEYSIPGFEGDLNLVLFKPSRKAKHDETSYYGGLRPTFYTQKEHFKFGDAIFEKLGQMLPNMINVLVISSNSSTHEKEDLFESIYSINNLIHQKDEKFFIRKKYQGIKDFLNQSKRLSGILFRTTWVGVRNVKNCNLLWINEQADQPIPETIKEYLKKMDKQTLLYNMCRETNN